MSLVTKTSRFIGGLVITFATSLAVKTSIAQSEFTYDSAPPPATDQPVEDLQGRAAVIDALGNYEINRRQAEIFGEQARGLRRENNLQQTVALQQQLKIW